MSEHECRQDNIWHMEERRFSVGCWACLYGKSIWPVWARSVVVSPAKRALMESVMARGIMVDTDGSDTLAFVERKGTPIWAVATTEELAAYEKAVQP